MWKVRVCSLKSVRCLFFLYIIIVRAGLQKNKSDIGHCGSARRPPSRRITMPKLRAQSKASATFFRPRRTGGQNTLKHRKMTHHSWTVLPPPSPDPARAPGSLPWSPRSGSGCETWGAPRLGGAGALSERIILYAIIPPVTLPGVGVWCPTYPNRSPTQP